MISQLEARAKNPFLHTTGILGVIFRRPISIWSHPRSPTSMLGRRRGWACSMLPHTLVTGIATRNGAVSGVETEHGTIRCETVVDAAGAWLRAVAALAGARVAIVPTRHQLLITEPIDGVDAMQPITRIIDANVYVRPDEGGLMLGGYEQTRYSTTPPLCRRASISPICRSILACCAARRRACASSCRCSSACPARSSCACIAADCRR